MIKIFISVTILILLSLFYIYNRSTVKESFTNRNCPDILMQKGKNFYLLNTKQIEVPGVNPIRFNNLEEYVQFINWQRSQNIQCPVLYLQSSYDTQGNLVYMNRKSPIERDGGTPIISGLDLENNNNRTLLFDSTRNNPPFNKNLYPGFDPDNQDIGLKTPLDKMFHENRDSISANPMDSNWGGSEYTESRITAGDYKDDEVKIYVPGSANINNNRQSPSTNRHNTKLRPSSSRNIDTLPPSTSINIDRLPPPPGGVDAVYGISPNSNINLQKQYKDHENHSNKVESQSQYIDKLHKNN